MVYAHFPVYLSDDCYLCVIESLSAGARVVSEQATNQSKTDNNEWEKIIFHPKKIEQRLLAHLKLNPKQTLLFCVIHRIKVADLPMHDIVVAAG